MQLVELRKNADGLHFYCYCIADGEHKGRKFEYCTYSTIEPPQEEIQKAWKEYLVAEQKLNKYKSTKDNVGSNMKAVGRGRSRRWYYQGPGPWYFIQLIRHVVEEHGFHRFDYSVTADTSHPGGTFSWLSLDSAEPTPDQLQAIWKRERARLEVTWEIVKTSHGLPKWMEKNRSSYRFTEGDAALAHDMGIQI